MHEDGQNLLGADHPVELQHIGEEPATRGFVLVRPHDAVAGPPAVLPTARPGDERIDDLVADGEELQLLVLPGNGRDGGPVWFIRPHGIDGTSP